MKLAIEFDNKNHRYYCDGREIPSVTRILDTGQYYKNVDKNVLANAAAKGSMLHQNVAYYIQTGDTMNEPLLINLEMLFRKLKEYTGEIIASEKIMGAKIKKMAFAGTADIITEKSVIEIKSNNTNTKLYWLQLAGYSLLAKENDITKPKNLIVIYRKYDNWGFVISTKEMVQESERIFLLFLQKHYLQKQIDIYFKSL